jgi:glycosyltransferase involved in cell wall biosynthesis
MMKAAPLVSVVTPFYNTQEYLRECIESVLRQTYQNWEYILVDNCSTDGSSEIAEQYESLLPGKIRYIRTQSFLSQVQNYNFALSCISPGAAYCKMVQADDWIFPECLERMVHLGEANPSVGILSSYYLEGAELRNQGLPLQGAISPCGTLVLPGKEVARINLRDSLYAFGTPTSVMFRASIVRNDRSFYPESLLHEDAEKCMQISQHWDFGFIQQVLTFSRARNQSITGSHRLQQPFPLDRYIIVRRYARTFLEAGEAARLEQEVKRWYYRILADQALRFRDRDFWQYHRAGLQTVGEKLDWPYLALQVGRELLWLAVNPGWAVYVAATGILAKSKRAYQRMRAR